MHTLLAPQLSTCRGTASAAVCRASTSATATTAPAPARKRASRATDAAADEAGRRAHSPAQPQQAAGVLPEDLASESLVSLQKWRVVDLKATLGELQQPKTGNKDVLVDRLHKVIQHAQQAGSASSVLQEQKSSSRRQTGRKAANRSFSDNGAHPIPAIQDGSHLAEDEHNSRQATVGGAGTRDASAQAGTQGQGQKEASLTGRPRGQEEERSLSRVQSLLQRSRRRASTAEQPTSKPHTPANETPGVLQQQQELPQAPKKQQQASQPQQLDTGLASSPAQHRSAAAGPAQHERQRSKASSESQLSELQAAVGAVGTEGEERRVIDDSFLPPLPIWPQGSNYGLHEADLPPKLLKVLLEANRTDMQLAFLGTTAFKPFRTRALGSVALLRGKDVWIFDAGDDLQRQLGALPTLRPSKVYRIFISRMAPDCLLGLPGLMCTIGAARARGHVTADIPVHIYGPRGIAEFLCTVFKVSNTYQEINLVVHEFVTYAVSDEERLPTLFNQRARVYRALVPPDVLNPQGGTDGNLDNFMPTLGRAKVQKGQGAPGGVLSFDPRAGFLPFEPFVPGDPSRQGEELPFESLSWTVQADISARFTAVTLPGHPSNTQASADDLILAFVIQEAGRQGSLIVDRAQALGLQPGDHFTAVKEGLAVRNDDGFLVPSSMCVTAPKPGRRVVIMGNCPATPPASSAFVHHAKGADILISGAVAPPSSPSQTREGSDRAGVNRVARGRAAHRHSAAPPEPWLHSPASVGLSPAALGQLAAQLGVDRLMLARLDMRQLQHVLQQGGVARQQTEDPGSEFDNDDGQVHKSGWSDSALEAAEAAYVEQLRQEALKGAASARGDGGVKVSVPFDFWVHILEKHEGPGPRKG